MADIETKTLLGRATAGTGAPQVLSIGTGFTVGASSIKVNVLDMLIADDTDKALSAKQGKVLNTTKANIASPTFTGTPAAPTAVTGTDTTQLATTEFVQQELDVHKAENAIDAHGLIPSVRLKHSVNQSKANGSFYAVNFDTEVYDTDSMYNPTTNNRITINTAGVYLMNGQVRFDISATGTRVLAIRKKWLAYIG